MTHVPATPFLKFALLADSVASGATAVLLLAGAGTLGELLGLPFWLMTGAGLVLLPYVAALAYVGTRDPIARLAVTTIIEVNIVWTLASFGVLASGAVHPTALGYAVVIAQAVAVLGFAALQFAALRAPAARSA
jgi:hypothetical protein